MKNDIAAYLISEGYEVQDFGTNIYHAVSVCRWTHRRIRNGNNGSLFDSWSVIYGNCLRIGTTAIGGFYRNGIASFLEFYAALEYLIASVISKVARALPIDRKGDLAF